MKLQDKWTTIAILCLITCIQNATVALRSPVGTIKHKQSGYYIHPYRDVSIPEDGTHLVLNPGGLGSDKLDITFVPQGDDYGYIKHVKSGKCIQPIDGSLKPGNGTFLSFNASCNEASLFKFNEYKNFIVHEGSGMMWHTNGFSTSSNTDLILHSDENENAVFYLTDDQGKKLSPICPNECTCPCGCSKGKWLDYLVCPRGC